MLKRIVDFLIFSNIYVAVPVSCLTIESFLIYGSSVDWTLVGFVYCSTLFVYGLHRMLGLKHFSVKIETERHFWAKNHKSTLIAVIILSAFGALYFVLNLPHQWEHFQILIPLAIVSLAYTIPWIRRNGLFIRLRDIPFLKIYLITLVVTCVTVVFPGTIMNLGGEVILNLFLTQALFVFAITIPFDIRDLEIDKPYKLKTMPLIFGEKGSKLLGILALVTSSVIALWLLPNNFFIPIVMANLIAAIVIHFTKREKGEYFYSLIVEGTMILQCGLVYFLS